MYTDIEPDILLQAYREGIFPMADSAQSLSFNFYRPVKRGLLPIDTLHVSRRLKKTLRQHPYKITVDTAFETVIDACAAMRDVRPVTWINKPIRDVFVALHEKGHAHSIECWKGTKFAGSVYGLKLGAVFCGESMVSFETDASKIALVHLAARLWKGEFTLLDAQFHNPHLEQFGLYEIPQGVYEKKIAVDMNRPASWIGTLPPAKERDLINDYIGMLGAGAR